MTKSLTQPSAPPRLDLRPLLALLIRAIRLPGVWLSRARARDELRNLDAAQLRDVGLNVVVVQREVRKPFWMA